MENPRVLVVGIGAVGAWLLARLTEHGADVTGWARGETFARLARGEALVLESPDGDWSGPVRVVDAPGGDWDLVIVCVKSQDTATVAAQLPTGPRIVSAQNGIENPDVLRGYHADVLGCVVYSGCERLGPVHVRNEMAGGSLTIGDADAAEWLTGHGVPTTFTDDIELTMWRKLLANAVGNSLTAILRTRFGPLRAVPEIEDVARAAVTEVVAVGRAAGVALGPADVDATLAAFVALPEDKTTSMLQDLEAGRPLEVDGLTGVVVRRAAAHGVDVPTIRTFDAFLRFVSP